MKSKELYLFMFVIFFSIKGFSQTYEKIPSDVNKETQTFISREMIDLKMDIYRLKTAQDKEQACMIFVFGGGFLKGERDSPYYNQYFTSLAKSGITVISIDYRLGLKGAEKVSPLNTKPLENAIQMAVEDLFAATEYILEHADALKVDKEKIMISGSSAGAITVLQAEYIKRNNFPGSEKLPSDFQYAGVLSFAGAIFSNKGLPRYETAPAPTLFFHGEKDRLVFYNKLQLFNKGFFGSKSLTKRFKKEGYTYCFYSVERMGHAVAGIPLVKNTNQILEFIQEYVYNGKQWQMDIRFNDKAQKTEKTTTVKNLYD